MHELDQQFELHPPTIESSHTNVGNITTRTNPSGADNDGKDASKATLKPTSSAPIPMSMPSILRNPGVSRSNHLAHLLDQSAGGSASSSQTKPRASGSTKELGRRKQRRSENARLLSNPHAVRPTIKDYRLHSNQIRSTFPASPSSSTIPGTKPYNLPVPSSSGVGYSEPAHDAASANHGHFGKSLKHAQRVLKRLDVGSIGDGMIREQRAGELERFIWLVDREIRTWAQDDVHVFASGEKEADRKRGRVLLDRQFNFTQPPLWSDTESLVEMPTVHLDTVQPNSDGQLIEFQRTPNALVWLVHDPFLRLVVHCLARVSRCPSFSKDDVSRPGLRFTWILNPNPLARRSRRGRRVSVSSSAMSVSATHNAPDAELGPTAHRPQPPPLRTIHLAESFETPPTTDFDSQTESELGVDTEPDTDIETDSLASSMVIVEPNRNTAVTAHSADEAVDAEDEERFDDNGEGDAVDTDEEEAEILRRVRRWAIDSHRQRAQHQPDDAAAPTSSRRGKPRSRLNKSTTSAHDPDQTLTSTMIAEEEDNDEDDDDADDDILTASDA